MKLLPYLLFLFLIYTLMSCDYFSERVQKAMPITSMSIEDPVRRYYPVVRGDTLKVSYKFTNTGNYPLVIRDVQAGCACITIDDYNRPIKPNKSAYLNFEYDKIP